MMAPNVMEAGEAPMPVMGDDDVLVRIQALGICGSDLHYFSRGGLGACAVQYPYILGHEAAGVVEAVGKNVRNFVKGDRVTMEPGIPCFHCEMCLHGLYNLCPDMRFWATPPYDGCLVEYVAHPAAFTFKLPDNVSVREGALVEPLAVGLSAAEKGEVKLGDTVVIFGAGCVGLVTLLAAKARGASKIIIADVLASRLNVARSFGGIPIDSGKQDAVAEIMALTGGRGADVVIDCCGISLTVQQSLKVARLFGRVILVGLGSDVINGIVMSDIADKELTIAAIHRYRNQYPVALNAIANGTIDIGKIISHEYRFEDTPAAFAECIQNMATVVKGVILY